MRALAERLVMQQEWIDPNASIQMWIALRVLRAWNSGTAGYDALVVWTVNNWIDAGMIGPIPWPDSPFFAEWAAQNGLSNVSGHIAGRRAI